MRLSDVGLRRRQTKLIYPDHRSSPWLIEAAAPRSLEPIVRQPGAALQPHAWPPPIRKSEFLDSIG
jgi:hypothetical protein